MLVSYNYNDVQQWQAVCEKLGATKTTEEFYSKRCGIRLDDVYTHCVTDRFAAGAGRAALGVSDLFHPFAPVLSEVGWL